MKCNGLNEFHNLHLNYYFKDTGFLGLLESYLRGSVDFNRELVGSYINLRFERNRLVLKFKRSINSRISYIGFREDVLDKFIEFGITELFDILAYYGIKKEVFEKNVSARNYTLYHLANRIGCNIETEQPEILNRLKTNQRNDLESLGYIGLNNLFRCIDFSHGYAEHEIIGKYPQGVSLDIIKRDLEILEPKIKPPQITIDKYLDKNNEYYHPKFYMLIKGFMPIPEFSIEPYNYTKNDFLLEYNTPNENHYLNILEELMCLNIKVRDSKRNRFI